MPPSFGGAYSAGWTPAVVESRYPIGPPFWKSALDGVEWSASSVGRSFPGEIGISVHGQKTGWVP
jgi:hypothetical protein